MMWRCLVLRSDPPGCSTFARNRLSPNGHFRAQILRCELKHIARYRMSLCGVAWRCVALRCDQPGCSTFARYRSSLTDLSRPNFILPKELIVRHQAPLRGAVLHSAERELRCARESVYAARAFPLPQIYVAFRTHRTVLRSVVLRGLALRPAGPQQFRAIPFVLNRPFCAPNFALH